jgi:hypothetical protein
VDEQILKRIKESKKKQDKREQRMSLILRYPQFQDELNKIVKELGKDFLCKYHEFMSSLKDDMLPCSLPVKAQSYINWNCFLTKWNIAARLDKEGNLDFISSFPITVTYNKESDNFPGYLGVKIDRWTTLQDIKDYLFRFS